MVWRALKCIALVGGKTVLTCAGLKTTPSHVSQYRAENGNLRKSESPICHCTMFAPKQCLYQKEARGMESPKMYRSSRLKHCTYLCGTANYPVSCMSVQGRERKFTEIRVYLCYGTVFAPKQCLYQKEATGMESPKMYSSSRWKNRTYLCGTAYYSVSCKPV